MKLNELLEFRKDLYFEGAVQSDWFYNPNKSKNVSENFVFHGKKYYGVDNTIGNKRIDTISFLKAIGEKLNDDSLNPFSLAIADYGTGKSHLSVTIAQLLSGPTYMPDTYKKIIKNISIIDNDDSNDIEKLYANKNLVLVINGIKDFNLHSELLKAAQKSLKLYGISDDKLRKINKSIETAEIFFDRNIDMFLSTFEDVAYKHEWHEKGDNLKKKIRDLLFSDDCAFEIVNDVYEIITGHEIRWDEGLSATDILEVLIKDYCGVDGEFDSVVIVFDEFGRYLEYASSVGSGKSGDSALQQIFECSQNSEGKLHILNFIQSDIKTYLQRVDNTKNISRYIGRYDSSDKYYISSNLETVFANLIHRKDENLFESTIVKKQNAYELLWKNIFDLLNKWCVTSGVWSDYNLFRKVIVEGVYPMHPISTFMLCRLSDYLQNRSSLSLVSNYINNCSDFELDDKYFTVYPEELMKGDLFTEMLSAEQEGKQASQYCIQYYNVLRKFEDKLNENQLKILRANLVLRILKCHTTSFEEVKKGLCICSGLSKVDVEVSIKFLVDEYGILGFDNVANCFDFMEESNGAHDYKIVKKRLLAKAEFDAYILRNNQDIMELAGDYDNIHTAVGLERKITTNEWAFKQQLYYAEDISSKLINNFIKEWHTSIDPHKCKGQLIWVFVNRDIDCECIEKIKRLSAKLYNTPIYLMILNDRDNLLTDNLIEYTVLNNMDEELKAKYESHYNEDVEKNRDRIKTAFNQLKKERLYFTPTENGKFGKRLSKELTKVFLDIYPRVASFNYDGLITTKQNIAPKSTKNFYTIIKLLLSNELNYGSIHNQQIEIRNRIEALLYCESNTSWKCLNSDYKIVPPEEPNARYIFDEIEKRLDETGEINCGELLNDLTKPPYGLNTYSSLLMIALFLVCKQNCSRIRYNNDMKNTRVWRDSLFVKEGKLENKVLLESTIVKVEVEKTMEEFKAILNKISDNKDIDKISSLELKLNQLSKREDILYDCTESLQLAEQNINNGKHAKAEWDKKISTLNTLYEKMKVNNLYPGLQALEIINKTDFSLIFSKFDYMCTDKYIMEINNLENSIKEYIDENFDQYLSLFNCKKIEKFSEYKKFGIKVINTLINLNYTEYADELKSHVQSELKNIGKLRDKENVIKDCKNFISKCKIGEYISLIQLNDYEETYRKLNALYAKYKDLLEEEDLGIEEELNNIYLAIQKEKENINNEVELIYEDVHDIKNYQQANRMLIRCEKALARGLLEEDKNRLEKLHNELIRVINDIKLLSSAANDRDELDYAYTDLMYSYDSLTSDDDIWEEVIEAVNDEFMNELDQKEQSWIDKYLKYSSDDIHDIYKWIEDTKVLPPYLSEDTVDEYNENYIEAEKIISQNRIQTAKHYYDMLSDEEKMAFKLMIKE